MYSLRTLKMNLYTGFKVFNIPAYIQWSSGLRSLEIHVNTEILTDQQCPKLFDYRLTDPVIVI